jgi:hypothetical protein
MAFLTLGRAKTELPFKLHSFQTSLSNVAVKRRSLNVAVKRCSQTSQSNVAFLTLSRTKPNWHHLQNVMVGNSTSWIGIPVVSIVVKTCLIFQQNDKLFKFTEQLRYFSKAVLISKTLS